MNTFANAVLNDSITPRTANGMRAHATTSSAVLDLFGMIGSARGKDVSQHFMAAIGENEELAVRTLLWARDIRGGAGERQTFRNLLAALEKANPSLAGRIMHKVPELGRWDDLFVYTDHVNRLAAFEMIGQALRDQNGLFTRGVALDYAKTGIRCNAICPGWVDTPINYAHADLLGGLQKVYDGISSFQPIGRPGEPREIAHLVLFLASDEASFITGSIISADGGMSAM